MKHRKSDNERGIEIVVLVVLVLAALVGLMK